MNIKDSIKLMEIYAACPRCGCEVLGNGKGTLECDTAVGYFRRTCACGWYVEVKEGLLEEPVTDLRPELTLEDEDEDEVSEDEVSEPEGRPTLEEEPVPEPEPDPAPTHTPEPEMIQPWRGFVHIRCEACHREATACLRTPTTTYTCRHCNHRMDLPKPFRAHTRCECGQTGRYLTNVPDWNFDIPCAQCGAPNAVTYHRGKDCYVPVGDSILQSRPKKKK